MGTYYNTERLVVNSGIYFISGATALELQYTRTPMLVLVHRLLAECSKRGRGSWICIVKRPPLLTSACVTYMFIYLLNDYSMGWQVTNMERTTSPTMN